VRSAPPLPPPPTIECPRRASPGPAAPGADEWAAAGAFALREWSGAPDPLADRLGPTTFALLWDPLALHLRVDVAFAALHVDGGRPRAGKCHGLWEFDVAELFISRGQAPLPYGEVEGSPLGQWLDYLIVAPRSVVDREWRSGASVRGALGDGRFAVEIDLPWAGLGTAATAGTALRFNVLVAQGPPGQRRHLCFSPTGTPEPDFHVPARFAHLLLR
jgi:alpha-galactosidase